MKYLMLFIIVLFLAASYYSYYKKNMKMYYVFLISSALLLVLYSGFRAYIGGNVYVGNDYESYGKWFDSIQNINILKPSDFLFNLLMLIVKVCTNSYLVFIFISAILLIASVYYFSIFNTNSDKSPSYVWAIYTFLTFGIYELSMSSIRQWMAGSVFLFAFRFIKEKKFWHYFILILIASLFHSSALFLIVIYPFVNIKLDMKKKIIYLSIFTVILSLVAYFKLDYRIISFFDKSLIFKYPIELQNSLHSNYTVFIISMCCLLCIMYFMDSYKKIDNNYNINICYLLLLVSVSFIATKSSLFCRLLQYFLPAMMLIIPSIINIFEKKLKLLAKFGAAIVLFLIYIM